jgi:hypothetical protein
MLLGKLNAYGMKGESDLCDKTHLSNRFQFVEIKETDCSNYVSRLHLIMQESGEWRAARLSSRPTFIFIIYQ